MTRFDGRLPLLILGCWLTGAGWAEGAAGGWPIPRGPAHDLVSYRYDAKTARAVKGEFLENAPACILYTSTTYLVEEDGTIECITHEITRFNGRKAIDKLGEYRSITFDPAYQRAILNEARVHKADGRVVGIEPRHVQFRDQITDYQVYDHEKQVVISFPNLEVGDAIEVKWTTRGKNPEHQGHFFARYDFGDDQFPVARDELRVRLPRKQTLTYAARGGKLEPEIKDEGIWRTYTWQALNRRELPQDENLPPKEELRLEVSCSTFASWDEVGKWKRDLRANSWKCAPEIAATVVEATKGLSKPEDKARALTYWLRRHIRYVSVGEKHDYTPHDPSEVLANRFGDCKDQSQLLAVMMRAAGLDVGLATLGTRGDGQVWPEVPCPWGTHAILLVTLDGKDHWIDTTVSMAAWDFLPQSDRDRVTYVVDDKSIRLLRTPALRSTDNRIEQETIVSVGSDGSSRNQRRSLFVGLAAMAQREEWLEVPPGERRRLVTSDLQNNNSRARLRMIELDAARLADFDQPVEARIDFEVPGQFRGEGDREGSISDGPVWAKLLSVNLDYERTVALDLGAPFESVHRFTVKLPPAYRLEGLPESHRARSRWGDFRVNVKPQAHGPHELEVEMRLRMTKTRIEPADKEEFRRFFEAVSRFHRVWLTLKPTQDLADLPGLVAVAAFAPGDSESAAALVRLTALYEQGDEARAWLRRARFFSPQNKALWELGARVTGDPHEEEVAYEELLSRFPGETKFAVALGEARINGGDYVAARAVLEPLTQKGPRRIRGIAHYQLARCSLLETRPAEALGHLDAAVKADPETVAGGDALVLKARILEQLKRPAEAIAIYKAALKEDPESREILGALARLELDAREQLPALDYLRRYTVAVAKDPGGLVEAARLHLQMHRYEDAFELASRARVLNFSPAAHRVLGLVYLHRQEWKETVHHLIQADPDTEVIGGLIQAYLAEGNLTAAESQFRFLPALPEPPPELVMQFAHVMALIERRNAIEQLVPSPAGLATNRRLAVDRLVCAECLFAAGAAPARVEKILEPALASDLHLGMARSLRAVLALEQGRLDQAQADAEAALLQFPDDGQALYVRGRVRLERKEAGAVDDLRRAATACGFRDADKLHWLATALWRAGNLAEARIIQKQAVALKPDDAEMADSLRRLEKSSVKPVK
jgi:tetratricopeptide (TPR) repeat protein